MKKITKPKNEEEAVYYCDFTGHYLDSHESPTSIKFEFGYGSNYDEDSFTLHLDNNSVDILLDFIKNNLTDESKKVLAKKCEYFKLNV